MFIPIFPLRYAAILGSPCMCSEQPPMVRRSSGSLQVPRRVFFKLMVALPLSAYANDASPEYDRFASSYEILDGLTHFTKFLGFDKLRASLLGHAYGNVLELAAGTGINFPLYPTTVVSLTALDVSPGMLEIASSRVSKSHLPVSKLNCIVSDASSTGLPSSSFDTVVVTFGFCVFDDPDAVLREAYRLLKSNGSLLVLDYTESSNSALSTYQGAVAPFVTRLSKGCTPNLNLLHLANQAGFAVVSQKTILGGIIVALQLQPASKLASF